MNKLTVSVITLNEEDNIKRCLLSIKDIADEVIVVDSGSTDKTIEIAKALGAKVYTRKLDNFATQKNFCLSKCSNEWVQSLDADEVIAEDLGQEIKKAIDENEYAGFIMGRRNFILGGEIKYTRWSPDQHLWLWKKDLGKWVGDVHEEVEVSGRVGKLKGSKIHYSHKTVREFLNANNQYSTLESIQMFDKKIKFSLFRMFWDSIFEFLLRFFYKKGFLDGWRGFVLSFLMGIYKITVWVKVAELQNPNKK